MAPFATLARVAEFALTLFAKLHLQLMIVTPLQRIHVIELFVKSVAFVTIEDWLARKPLRALELSDDWSALLAVVDWLQAQPRPGIYLRQMDAPDMDTKFLEKHRGVLAELLDLALPPEAVDASTTGASGFAERYGFEPKPERVRFRIVDRGCAPLPWNDGEDGQDLTLGIESFAALEPPVWRAIVTENEVNYLALPPLDGAIAVFGSGYGFEALGQAAWLAHCRLYYWGDIDTHGFAILDQLRGQFENAESLLMDADTFMRFRRLWGHEQNPTRRDLRRLSQSERELYDRLRNDFYGQSLRLEQERIGFGWVRDALAKLPGRGSKRSLKPRPRRSSVAMQTNDRDRQTRRPASPRPPASQGDRPPDDSARWQETD